MKLDPRPLVPPQRLAWTAFAACLAARLGASFLERLNPVVGLWFTEIFCLLGVAWAITRWSGRSPAAYVRPTWPGLPTVLFASALAVANFVGLAAPINALSQSLAPESLRDAFDITHIIEQYSTVDLWLFATAAVLVAACCEEFLFRGVVQHGLSDGGAHPVEAVFRAALLFSVIHFNPVAFLALLELGLFFGFLYHRTGSLVPSIVAHATHNATALGIYFIARHTEGPEPSGTQVLGMAGMGCIALAMLFLLGRHFPSLWGKPTPVDFERPRVSLSRAFAPWLLAASFSILGWLLLDRRGVELSVADMHVEVPAARADEPPEVRSARLEMETLRNSVRRGTAPLERYLESRRALAQLLEEHPKSPAAK